MELNKDSPTRKYLPQQLHFPWVALDLQWMDLPVIDWPELNRRSLEFSFLKELGVREVPLLTTLIERIDEEHRKQKDALSKDYSLPLSLRFLGEHFSEHYSKQWKSNPPKKPFLPSLLPQLKKTEEVREMTLLLPSQVFKGSSFFRERLMKIFLLDGGPLCPSLFPEVIRCLNPFLNLKHLGVENRPSISVAFDILMKNRDVLLNIQSAPRLFAYLNGLDGLNQKFIQHLSTLSFIPHPSESLFFFSLLSLRMMFS